MKTEAQEVTEVLTMPIGKGKKRIIKLSEKKQVTAIERTHLPTNQPFFFKDGKERVVVCDLNIDTLNAIAECYQKLVIYKNNNLDFREIMLLFNKTVLPEITIENTAKSAKAELSASTFEQFVKYRIMPNRESTALKIIEFTHWLMVFIKKDKESLINAKKYYEGKIKEIEELLEIL